jgi:hypothetical protein
MRFINTKENPDDFFIERGVNDIDPDDPRFHFDFDNDSHTNLNTYFNSASSIEGYKKKKNKLSLGRFMDNFNKTYTPPPLRFSLVNENSNEDEVPLLNISENSLSNSSMSKNNHTRKSVQFSEL